MKQIVREVTNYLIDSQVGAAWYETYENRKYWLSAHNSKTHWKIRKSTEEWANEQAECRVISVLRTLWKPKHNYVY